MGRRRKVLLEEEDSDFSQSDADVDEWGSDADDLDNPQRRRKRRKTEQDARSDWTKAPSFVSGDRKAPVRLDDDEEEGDDDDDDDFSSEESDHAIPNDSHDSDGIPQDAAPLDSVAEEEAPMPRIGGIGFKSGLGMRAGLGSSFSKAGLGSAQSDTTSSFTKGADLASSEPPTQSSPSLKPSLGGIGSGTRLDSPSFSDGLPSSFGAASASKSNSFLRTEDPSPSPKPVLSAAERAHFAKLSGSFGARMMAKMGWESGTGLGTSGEGIVAPVETKLRPQKMGIAFRGFKEKTEQSKMEARRRGEDVSDDEDEKTKKARKAQKQAKERQADVWRRPKKVKTQVVHKSYEEYIAEAGQDMTASSIGQIIDATGTQPREVSSLADISLDPWSSLPESTRIPEIRHNIRLINDSCKSELDGLAREARDLDEKKKFVSQEDARLRRQVENEAELIARLQRVQLVTNEVNMKAKELMSSYEPSLDPLSPLFSTLLTEYPDEFQRYRLDEVVVAAIAPLLKRMVSSWDPLTDPYAFMSTFRLWKGALRVNTVDESSNSQVDVYGSATLSTSATIEKPMTPFESLLWNVWLPKVRTYINNEWSPADPQPAIKLYEAWSSFLPPFIRDNMLDQLIIPKVHKAVAEWTPKRQESLQSIVFPWLPHVGLRLEEFVGDARRKIKALLRSWSVHQEVPTELLSWKEVFDKAEWDTMLLKYVVPKLGATLREDFKVNPRTQNLEPLERVFKWSSVLSPTVLSQIIETEFFHKWLDVLYIWLIQPNVNYGEVADWYSDWSEKHFPAAVRRYAGVERGFTRGQQLINEALALRPNVAAKLVRPDWKAEISKPKTSAKGANGQAKGRKSGISQEITFRSLVEEFAASQNLLFIPAGKVHSKSRMPMYRVSQTVDGRGGLLVYILDDAVWAAPSGVGQEDDDFVAISLDDMVTRASV